MNEINLPNIDDSHIKRFCISNINENKIKIFEFKLFKYTYDSDSNSFQSIKFEIKTSFNNIHANFLNGLTSKEVFYQKQIFGICDLNIHIDSVIKLIFIEISDPFYLFSVIIVIYYIAVWHQLINIVVSTILYLILIFLSTLYSVLNLKNNLISIQKIAKYSCPVNVLRLIDSACNYIIINNDSKYVGIYNIEENENDIKNTENKFTNISSIELVPGDLIELPENGNALPCDLILINGNVIVNESMLTGESIPVVKTPIPKTDYWFNVKTHKQNIIYAGTKIIQKRVRGEERVLGLVISTSFETEKGNLIRSIIYAKEIEFKFQKDSVKYIYFMICLSIIDFFILVPVYLKEGFKTKEYFMLFMDLISVAIPPSLPFYIAIGVSYALLRLKKCGIICINRQRVNMSGKVNLICFDKTGTLTEDHLDINGLRPVKTVRNEFIFDNFYKNVEENVKCSFEYYKSKIYHGTVDRNKDLNMLIIECLATCHNLTRINGKIAGDPIDVKMFESSGWVLNENSEKDFTYVRPFEEKEINEKLRNTLGTTTDNDFIIQTHYELGIIRRFEFSSTLQRMSVLVKNNNEPYFKAFCKGSPEKIIELCKQDTIPNDFNLVLSNYTMRGFRVLAISAKIIDMELNETQKIERSQIECNMIFLGFLVVQNKLKEKTKSSIKELHEANYRMVMVTGDNIFTAISVANECGLISGSLPIYLFEIDNDKEKNINEVHLNWNLYQTFQNNEDSDTTSKMSDKSESSRISHHFNPDTLNSSGKNYRDSLNVSDKKTEINEHEYDSLIVNINIEKYSNLVTQQEDYIIAITGSIFENLFKLHNKYLQTNIEKFKIHYDTFKLILKRCYIFARMSPEHKTNLVNCLKNENFTVCMCGDGTNDCGALKAADVGVSLSIEEASIAAHFTSNSIGDISCLIKLFREGKASLTNTIQTFRFMMSVSILGLVGITLCTIRGTFFAPVQFLIIDFFFTLPISVLIARTGAYHTLSSHQPIGNLISVHIIGSFLLQFLLILTAQLSVFFIMINQKWYIYICGIDNDDYFVKPCYDNTVKFLIN